MLTVAAPSSLTERSAIFANPQAQRHGELALTDSASHHRPAAHAAGLAVLTAGGALMYSSGKRRSREHGSRCRDAQSRCHRCGRIQRHDGAQQTSPASSAGITQSEGLPEAFIEPWTWLDEAKAKLHADLDSDLRKEFSDIPQQDEAVVRGAVGRITAAAQSCVAPSAVAKPFGSTVNGFGVTSSDLDVLIAVHEEELYYYMSYVSWLKKQRKWDGQYSQPRQRQQWPQLSTIKGKQARTEAIFQLQACLTEHGFKCLKALPNARKPLLTVADQESDLSEVDVSINNRLPLYNSRLLKAFADLDPRVRPFVLCVKAWAKARRVCGAGEQGNLSSYSWTIMAIYFLQLSGILPSLQRMSSGVETISDIDYWGDPQTFDVAFMPAEEYLETFGDSHVREESKALSLADLFYGFINFFAEEYRWGEEVVSICDPIRMKVTAFFLTFGSHKFHSDPLIYVEDPIEKRDLNVVMTRAERLEALKSEFRRARMLLESGASLEEIMSAADMFVRPGADLEARSPPPLP